MTGLLKADFRRVFKDKLIIVMAIIAAVFAVITPALYVVILLASGGAFDTAGMPMQMFGDIFSAKTQFFSSFSMGNNFGLIAPVFLAIVLCKDFSYGTIRNKIIAGKSRSAIFMSLFTTCSVVFSGIMFLHSFLTLGISLIFFDYQYVPFTFDDFLYFVESLVLELLILIFISALLSYLCANMKNVGLAIVLYIAVSFGLVMVGGIVQVAQSVLLPMDVSETVISAVEFFDKINVGTASSRIGMGTSYSLEDILYNAVPPIIGIIGFVGLGLIKFNKTDLK